jgi:hypothetical protein
MLEMPIGAIPKKLFDFQINYNITDFCYTKSGFLFLLPDDHCIGRAAFNGKIELPFIGKIGERGKEDGYSSLLSYPSSICYYKDWDIAFVIENGGNTIKEINFNPPYTINLLTEAAMEPINKFFINSKERIAGTCCDVVRDRKIYWGVRNLHRIFKREEMDTKIFFGNGRSGFSLANKKENCFISCPSGVKVLNKCLYVLEQGNNCIRQIQDDKISIVAGVPQKSGDEEGNSLRSKFNSPRRLTGFRNMLYFIDGNKIKYCALIQKQIGTAYTSNDIVSIDSDQDKKIYIMEKQK